MFEKYNDILTIKELCEALGISRVTAMKYIANGTIKAGKAPNGKSFISKAALFDFLGIQNGE